MKTAAIMLAALVAIAVARADAQQDLSQVQIKTTKLAGNFYTLEGSGGMIGVLVGPDGVFMVDSQFAPLTEKIVAAIKQVSDGRIRFMVNTHVHGDHTGGDENFAKLGVAIIARDELRERLARPVPATATAPARPGPAASALPMVTYKGSMTIHMNGEDVRLIAVPAAHTDGDTMVYFPSANVLMTGDFYRSLGYPNIDRANGGSLKGMLDGLAAVVDLAGPATKIIPGHGETVDKTAVAAQRALMIAVRDKIAPLVQQGKTLEEVVAAKPTADYDARVPQGAQTSERFVGQVYAELKAAR